MTTIGFHYFPDDLHYRTHDLQAWLPELKGLGARWLTVVGSLTRAVPEPFLRGLRENDIEPIVLIPAGPVRALDAGALAPLFSSYARWGVKYVSVFAEPNSRSSWSPSDWSKTGIVDRFIEIMAPIWQAQHAAGLAPVFPALKAGGEYWDTAFLEAALVGLQRRNQHELLNSMAFALNTWSFNRPVSYGAGGPAKWPGARPYLTAPGVEDQRGFHVFDWYNAIFDERLGERRPLISLAGGPRLGDQTDASLPSVNEARHASCTKEIMALVNESQLPTNLINLNFWLLTADAASPFAREAWFKPDGGTLAATAVLRSEAGVAQVEAAPAPGLTPGSAAHELLMRLRTAPAGAKSFDPGVHKVTTAIEARPLRHYLLLPTFEWGVSEWHWAAALDVVRAHQPTVGFSADEAGLAAKVTILGNEQGISTEVEAQLRGRGCEVERVSVGR